MTQQTNQLPENMTDLKKVLEQQHIRLAEMLSILHQEHRALTSNDLPSFEDVVQRKHAQVKALEEIQPLLGIVEKAIGGVLSKSTFDAFIQRIPHGQEKTRLESLWKSFQETLQQCNTQNLINNRILSASNINVKQALNILRGNTAANIPDIYGSKGQHQDCNNQRQSLAIA